MAVDMENLKPNSHKYNESQTKERAKLEKVVNGEVKIRRKSLGRRFIDTFFAQDKEAINEYLFIDVFVPAVKNMVIDLITQGINMVFYGEARKSNPSSVLGSKTSYEKMFRSPQQLNRVGTLKGRNSRDLGEIVVDNRGEAERIIGVLTDLTTSEYGQASVADLYDLLNVTVPGDFTSQDWGWTSMKGAQVVRIRDGYLIDLPKCVPLR